MKLTDKRIWKFEAVMLLCGVATVCVEALSYGISLFYLIGQLLIYPLCFCVGGVATWKVSKAGKVTLSKILCKWKQDSVVSLFLYLNSVFKHKHKLIHNQAPV